MARKKKGKLAAAAGAIASMFGGNSTPGGLDMSQKDFTEFVRQQRMAQAQNTARYTRDTTKTSVGLAGIGGPIGGVGYTGPAEPTDPKLAKLCRLPSGVIWYNNFIEMIDRILEKKELDIEQLEWVPSFIRELGELVDFGGKRAIYEGYKNAFWRCIHRVDSLIFQDYEFMKQLRQMLCEARQMKHPDANKTWAEIEAAEAEAERPRNVVPLGAAEDIVLQKPGNYPR